MTLVLFLERFLYSGSYKLFFLLMNKKVWMRTMWFKPIQKLPTTTEAKICWSLLVLNLCADGIWQHFISRRDILLKIITIISIPEAFIQKWVIELNWQKGFVHSDMLKGLEIRNNSHISSSWVKILIYRKYVKKKVFWEDFIWLKVLIFRSFSAYLTCEGFANSIPMICVPTFIHYKA